MCTCVAGCVQYPGEKEITFPPFTCLESDGDPHVERTLEGEAVVFPLKVAPPSPTNSPAFPGFRPADIP